MARRESNPLGNVGREEWREFCGRTGLDPRTDGLAVSAVAAALTKGSKLSGWVQGEEPCAKWLGTMGAAALAGGQGMPKVLDSWDRVTRESVSGFAEEHVDSLPDLFAELREAEEGQGGLKRRGAIYTPGWLARAVTRKALAHWRRLHRGGRVPRAIADLSCGVGVFLAEARTAFGEGPLLYGIDNDPMAVAYCGILKDALGGDWTTYCADSLVDPTQGARFLESPASPLAEIDLDMLLGNPPYVRAQLLDRRYAGRLRGLYPCLAGGNADLAVAFLEQGLDALAPGGMASYIVSSKFMTSTYGKAICERLADDARVINIEDFGDDQLFPGRTTYTCVLTFAKVPPAKRFTVTRHPAGMDRGRPLGKPQSYTLPRARLEAHPWDFTSGPEQEALTKLRGTRHPLLTEVFSGIMQGLRTGANQVYVLPQTGECSLEPELLIPFVTGEDIRRLAFRCDRLRLLFPYRYDLFGEPVLLSEEELGRHPRAWSYLLSKRRALAQRALDEAVPWYAFSRTQNLRLPRTRKVLVREMMPRAEFAADFEGGVAFSSGYALVAHGLPEDELRMWTAVLNTPTMEFALRHNGTQLHSGWFRLLKHHLGRTRLPRLSSARKRQAVKIAGELCDDRDDTRRWERLDKLVADAFGLTDTQRRAVYQFLEDCHKRSLSDAVRATSVSAPTSQGSGPSPDTSNRYQPVKLEQYDVLHRDRPDLRRAVTFVANKDLPIHRWYRLTQGFSAPLVEALLDELEVRPGHTVLDPFAGVGTTNVVCQRRLIDSVGIDMSPLMTWLSKIKTRRWDVSSLTQIVERLGRTDALPPRSRTLVFEDYLAKAYSPAILRQLVSIAEFAESDGLTAWQREFLLAGLVSIMEGVSQIRKHGSHYRYMTASENIGLQKLNTQIVAADTNIMAVYAARLAAMLQDVVASPVPPAPVSTQVIEADARHLPLPDAAVDFVVTSPPYLNRNNYIAQQKAEMDILDLLPTYAAYRELVKSTVRSHVEGRFPRTPESQFEQVRVIIDSISLASNNNPRIPHMVAAYFEDLDDVLRELARVVTPGGACAFVVGNSRWGGVVVPVDHLLLMIAERHGFDAQRVLVTRLKGNSPQQMRRYGRIPVRESIVLFGKP